MEVKIYGFDPELYPCVQCQKIKEFCNEHKIDFEFISVIQRNGEGKIVHCKDSVNRLEQDYGSDVTGISLPQIFVNNKYVGGSGAFKKLYLEGKFNESFR